jgi:hypothetical protein
MLLLHFLQKYHRHLNKIITFIDDYIIAYHSEPCVKYHVTSQIRMSNMLLLNVKH